MNERRLVEYDCYLCDGCRNYGYNEFLGDSLHNIPAKTHVAELPDSWHCPLCGADKSLLRPSTMLDGFIDSSKEICQPRGNQQK